MSDHTLERHITVLACRVSWDPAPVFHHEDYVLEPRRPLGVLTIFLLEDLLPGRGEFASKTDLFPLEV